MVLVPEKIVLREVWVFVEPGFHAGILRVVGCGFAARWKCTSGRALRGHPRLLHAAQVQTYNKTKTILSQNKITPKYVSRYLGRYASV